MEKKRAGWDGWEKGKVRESLCALHFSPMQKVEWTWNWKGGTGPPALPGHLGRSTGDRGSLLQWSSSTFSGSHWLDLACEDPEAPKTKGTFW